MQHRVLQDGERCFVRFTVDEILDLHRIAPNRFSSMTTIIKAKCTTAHDISHWLKMVALTAAAAATGQRSDPLIKLRDQLRDLQRQVSRLDQSIARIRALESENEVIEDQSEKGKTETAWKNPKSVHVPFPFDGTSSSSSAASNKPVAFFPAHISSVTSSSSGIVIRSPSSSAPQRFSNPSDAISALERRKQVTVTDLEAVRKKVLEAASVAVQERLGAINGASSAMGPAKGKGKGKAKQVEAGQQEQVNEQGQVRFLDLETFGHRP